MASNWPALHAQFLNTVHRHSFLKPFRAIGARRPGIGRFRDPVALLDWLHGPGDPDDKNAALGALVEEAQTPAEGGAAAVALLALALWPGLDAAHGRLIRFYRRDPDTLASELGARFVEQVLVMRLDRVNRIAATAIRNVERDIRRRLSAEQKVVERRIEVDPDDLASGAFPAQIGIAGDTHEEGDLRRLGERLASIVGADAELVIDIAIRRTPQREAAEARGLSHDAGRKRYQRALARLAMALAA